MGDFFLIGILLLVILSFIIASQGENRKIGFWPSLFISLIFTPIIGLLIVLVSEKKETKVKTKLTGEPKKMYEQALNDYESQNFEDAIEKLKKANGLLPNNPTILIGLAYSYSRLANYSEAIDYIERAISSGYDNYRRIQKSDGFKELRDTELFANFVKNGYKRS